MKILALADEEVLSLWDYYTPGKLKGYDLIISSGDLKASYLSFLVTMANVPVLYVHGNHDTDYSRNPPEGCDCIEDRLVVYNGVRILGLGGCRKYRPGDHQYTDKQMRRRIRRLRWKLWRSGGVDIVVTHVPPTGLGDLDDYAHRGFDAFVDLLDKYHPQYLLHGHIHKSYSHTPLEPHSYAGTQIINVCPQHTLELPDLPVPPKLYKQLVWK